MNDKEEFKKQVNDSILKSLSELKTEPKFEKLKKCYSENFEKIEAFISSSNPKSAIEDINDLCGLTYNKMDSFLMQEINNGIVKNIISKNNLK